MELENKQHDWEREKEKKEEENYGDNQENAITQHSTEQLTHAIARISESDTEEG